MSWRIGSIPYLNVRPLIYGIEDQVVSTVPSQLAELLHRGEFDTGIVPVAEVLRHDQYDILDNVAIAANGPVQSVLLFHREPIAKLPRIAVDTSSRSSVMLLRILLRLAYRNEPEFYPRPTGAKLDEHPAMLVIGDDAIRCAQLTGSWSVLDLSTAWREFTGLPFVFAVWAGQRGVFKDDGLRNLLLTAKANGLANIEKIVQATTEATPEFRREYLTRSIRYDLGVAEKQAVAKFQQYAVELGLIPARGDLRYVA